MEIYQFVLQKLNILFPMMLKTQNVNGDYNITIRDINLKTGAGFVVALAGKIMTMPGLPKIPSAESIDIDENGEIVGIF